MAPGSYLSVWQEDKRREELGIWGSGYGRLFYCILPYALQFLRHGIVFSIYKLNQTSIITLLLCNQLPYNLEMDLTSPSLSFDIRETGIFTLSG